MKKLLAIVLGVCLILSLSAMAAETYTLSDTFYGDQDQGPVWYYQASVDGAAWQDLNYTPDYGDNWQYSKDPSGENIFYSIFDWEGIGAQVGVTDGKSYRVAAVYAAPKAGTLTIAPWEHIAFNSIDGGAFDYFTAGKLKVSVSKNNSEVLYSAETDGTDQKSGQLTVEVAAGDRIYFIVDPNGNGAGPTVYMNSISVSLEAAAGAEPDAGEPGVSNPETGVADYLPLSLTALLLAGAALVLLSRRPVKAR